MLFSVFSLLSFALFLPLKSFTELIDVFSLELSNNFFFEIIDGLNTLTPISFFIILSITEEYVFQGF